MNPIVKNILAIVVGAVLGSALNMGINILMLPSPTWFTVIYLVGAYIQMGYLAGKLGVNTRKN